MAEPFLSTIWYRVADLRPRLRSHVRVHRHRYRGRPWYVLHDHATGRVHRFTPAAYMLIGQMDGRHTVDEVWRGFANDHEEDAPGQDQVIRLLSQLHQQDLIQYAGSPDVADLLERYEKQAHQLVRQNLLSPMSFRVPLWDPDRFLAWSLPVVRPLAGWFGLVLWLTVVAAGLMTAALHWQALTADLSGRLLATQNLLITLVTYPLLKALHELGHGYLTKERGGPVHEMGIMFLVLFPVPYVEASASAAFRSRWQRAAVAAGGIFVETFVAALAVIVWASAEPGMVRAMAYNLVMIGGLSTLIVNGNPLLKFDGYYVMCDLLEIPNLGTRANRFWGHLVQRHIFGATQLREEVATWGERVWFILYAPAAFVYRILIMVGIALYIGQRFFILGVLLALWSLFTSLVRPIFTSLRHVVTSPQLRKVRRRAMAIAFGGTGVVALAALLIPIPLHTNAFGVVWLPDAAGVRAGTDGFLARFAVPEGGTVAAGAPVAALEEPTLDARIAALEWRAEEMRRRLADAEVKDRSKAEVARLELETAEKTLARERDRRARLAIVSPLAGAFQPAMPESDMLSRYLSEGDLVGHVLPDRPDRVRAVVTQDNIALLRRSLRGVELAVEGRLGQPVGAHVLRAVPAASPGLPSPALGLAAGGPFTTDPADPDGLRLLEPVFLVDIALPDDMPAPAFGTRVLVRFDHGSEPAARQIWRRLRQLFLRQFNA